MTTIERQSSLRGSLAHGGHGRGRGSRKCNLCDGVFVPRTPFQRFCPLCKATNELLKFVQWLPEADDDVQARIPA